MVFRFTVWMKLSNSILLTDLKLAKNLVNLVVPHPDSRAEGRVQIILLHGKAPPHQHKLGFLMVFRRWLNHFMKSYIVYNANVGIKYDMISIVITCLDS